MSRLDSFIRRMQAQRACLDATVASIADIPGPVLELGLGNGRTFDHLRSLYPEREIYAFDRAVRAHPDCIPDPDHLFLGDIRDSLAAAARRLGPTAALAHADLGSGRPEMDMPVAAAVSAALTHLLRPGAVIVSDQALALEAWQELPLPEGVSPGRYYLYRKPAAG